MHLNESNGYWYVRKNTPEGKETVAKLGQHDDQPAIHRPHLLNEKASTLLGQLPDNSVDVVLTDPPYGVGMRVGRTEYGGQGGMGAKSEGKVHNHSNTGFLEGIAAKLKRVLAEDSHLYVFTNWRSYPKTLPYFAQEFDLSQVIVWEKPSYGVGDPQTWSPCHEFIMHFRHGSPNLRGKRPRNVITFKRPKNTAEMVVHSTQKPIKIMEYIIEKSSDPGDVVLDPFGGSYAVARAAQRTFRRGVSCELDPEIHNTGRELAKKQLHNDPEYGIDWTEVNNLRVVDAAIGLEEEDVQATNKI